MAFLAGHRNISEYDSENLTFSLIEDIFHEYPEFSHLGVFCHTPLRTVVRDWSLLNDEECKYISHYSTHLDFLIVNHVTKSLCWRLRPMGIISIMKKRTNINVTK